MNPKLTYLNPKRLPDGPNLESFVSEEIDDSLIESFFSKDSESF